MLHESLFEVQRLALEKGHSLPGFAYFLEMGLGKTRVGLYDAHWKLQSRLVDVAIILVPRSLKGAWRSEAEEIGFPHPVILVDSKGKTADYLSEVKKAPCLVVIHYDIVLTKGGDLIDAILGAGLKTMIQLDESTRIKNPQAKVGKCLIQLRDKFKYRRILTGSPAPQGPHDLWAQFKFLGLIDSPYFGFRNTYCRMGGWMGKQIVGAQNLDILRMRTDHGVFRGKKKDWTDLPEMLFPEPREIQMTKEQREAYLRMMHEFVLEWGDREITAKMAVTAKTKLAQIGSGFLYDNDGVPVLLFSDNEKNPKVEELLSIIEEVDTKILVFYHFKPSEGILRRALERQGINTVWLPSGLDVEEIERRKALFNGEDDYKVCVMQTASYKYGHTLLGTKDVPCHTTVFFENSYDGEARQQAEARNHRHGQKHPVVYIDLSISREDTKVIKALQTKSNLQESILAEFKSGAPTWN